MAILVNDAGPELDLVWTVIDDATGQIWCWSNREVRAEKNITWGRLKPEQPNGILGPRLVPAEEAGTR